MNRLIFMALIVFFTVGYSYSVRIKDFKDIAKFTTSILASGYDISKKRDLIHSAVNDISESSDDDDFRVAALDEIRYELSNTFPFVTSLVKDKITEIVKEDLYAEGKEAALGKKLFEAQKNKEFNVDILLRAARLLRMYDATYFEEVKKFMNTKGLSSYL